MDISKVNGTLRKVAEAIVSNRRLVKVSEMEIDPHKKGMFKVSYRGKFLALLVKNNKGWKGTTNAGSTDYMKSKEAVLKQVARMAPNAVLHKDGSHVR